MDIIKSLTIVISLYSSSLIAANIPAACSQQCISTYGTVLSPENVKVKAWSNCKSSCINESANTVDGIFTGIKWQCVEYARRWLIKNHNITFASIPTAADIWTDINIYKEIGFGDEIKVTNIENGSKKWPVISDLLIYDKSLLGTGHVAVVIGVDQKQGYVLVAEQNLENKKWAQDYARKISVKIIDDHVWLNDVKLLGWKTMMQ